MKYRPLSLFFILVGLMCLVLSFAIHHTLMSACYKAIALVLMLLAVKKHLGKSHQPRT